MLCRRGEVAANRGILQVGTQHHDDRVPTQSSPQLWLQLVAVRIRRLLVARNRIDVVRIQQSRRVNPTGERMGLQQVQQRTDSITAGTQEDIIQRVEPLLRFICIRRPLVMTVGGVPVISAIELSLQKSPTSGLAGHLIFDIGQPGRFDPALIFRS